MIVSNKVLSLCFFSRTLARKCMFNPPGRAISTTSVIRSRSLVNFKKLQSEFQSDDGKPIFLKRGLSDRILYSLTLVLCLIGVFNVVLVLYDQAKPPSWKAAK